VQAGVEGVDRNTSTCPTIIVRHARPLHEAGARGAGLTFP
jgi:hypothetical protein